MKSKINIILTALIASSSFCFGTPGYTNSTKRAQDSRLELPIPSHELIDIWSNRRMLSEFKHDQTNAIVLMFMLRPCPVVKLYLPRIKEMEAQYRAKGVQFLAIYSTPDETLNAIAVHGHDNDIAFPLLRDAGNVLLDTLNVERSSEVVVLDKEFKVRYQGAIDDQYRASGRREVPEKHYLRDALDQVLADQEVITQRTKASGCLLERAEPPTPVTREVTYSKHVAPIMQDKCAPCHRPGQVGPFSLLTYREAKRMASMIAEVVEDRRMPPWHAMTNEQRYGSLAHDRRLNKEQIQTILDWVRSGAREGNPEDLPEPRIWPEGWQIGEPDAVFEMQEEFQVPADGEVPYQYYTVETNFDHDVWIRAAEAQPGAQKAVHHINVHITRPNNRHLTGILALFQLFGRDGSKANALASYIPGDTSREYPEGYGILLEKGKSITFEMHYTPYGIATVDRSRVGIIFAKEPPKERLRYHALVTRGFVIPAGDPHYKLQNEIKFDKQVGIMSLRPHAHKRGKHVRYELVSPDGKRDTLLTVPRWDFNWQSSYEFAKPIIVPQGTRLIMTTTYDNSFNNPNNPDYTKDVTFGLQTSDEMMNGHVTYYEVD